MTDRDLEIELSTLRAELAAFKADEHHLVKLFRSPAFMIEGQRGDDLNLSPCKAAAKAMQDLWTELNAIKADRDDWRDIAIGLYDFGGTPLLKYAKRYDEHALRYEAKIKKGG